MARAPFELSIVPDVPGVQLHATHPGSAPADPLRASEAKLKAVLDISQSLAAARSLEEILPQVLDTLLAQVLPIADRGSILLVDPQTGAMVPAAQRHKGERDDGAVQLSRTVLDHVLRDKRAVRSIDAGTDERFRTSASIALEEIHSVMCAPLLSLEGEVLGIIHVDSHSTFAQFTAEDMDLLVAIAGQTALSYDSARQLLRQEQIRSEMELARHRALSQMVSGLAHELNTPLGIMSSAASVVVDLTADLCRRDLDEDAIDDLEDIAEAVTLLQKNLARTNHLVVEFKKLSTWQLGDHREVVPIGDLVGEILDVARTQDHVSAHEVAFRNHLSDPTSSWDGFPGHLTQVLSSLVDNAARHAYPDRSGRIEVHLSIEASADEIGGAPAYRIVVVDFGVGIEQDRLKDVFVPFVTTARTKGHRGLGLAVVYTIVHDSLGGAVVVDAAPGRGTMMTVSVPMRCPAQSQDEGGRRDGR